MRRGERVRGERESCTDHSLTPSPFQESLGVVDLRALEAAGVIDIERFPLAEDIQHLRTALAVAVAGAFGAAERQVNLGANRWRVNIHDPGVEIAHRAEGGV